MAFCGSSWHFMVVHGSSWHFIVVHGSLWHFIVVHGILDFILSPCSECCMLSSG